MTVPKLPWWIWVITGVVCLGTEATLFMLNGIRIETLHTVRIPLLTIGGAVVLSMGLDGLIYWAKAVMKNPVRRKKLKRTLSLTGAAIVLISFIAKDAETDGIRDIQKGLLTAQDQYIVSHNFAVQIHENESISNRLNAFLNKDVQQGKIPWNDLALARSSYYETLTEFNGVHRLYTSLPESARPLTNDEDLFNRADGLRRMLSRAEDACNAAQALLNSHDAGADEAVADARNSVQLFAQEVQSFGNGTHHLAEETSGSAAAIKDSNEVSGKHWEILYYAAFGIGWLVTIAGILIGEPEEKSVAADLAVG